MIDNKWFTFNQIEWEYFKVPIKNKSQFIERGTRVSGLRGDIETGKGNNRSTAPLDWYETFNSGGKLDQALTRGIRLAKLAKDKGTE